MAINQGDIDFAFYVLDNAIYSNQPLASRDCILIKKFIEALLEYQHTPDDNTKSREWRAAVYRKFLEDPEALQQFTEQAINKFGVEVLSQMVVPEIQEKIVAQHIEEMDARDLTELLKDHGKLPDILEYLMETEEGWVSEQLGISDRIDSAYDNGFAVGKDTSEAELTEEYNRGYNAGLAEAELGLQ